MSPAYDSREKYERWHVRICARCGRQAAKAANWSDGPICRNCLDKATRTYGPCPGCDAERLLPGRDNAGAPVCRDCAGITRDFFCDRCHFEGRLLGGRLCERCTLTDRLSSLLDDGTGRIHPPLIPLFDQLRTMQRPTLGLSWVQSPQPLAMLRDLASGRLELTHEAFQQLPNWRSAAYLRDLLMQSGVLPLKDRQLLLFERWLDTHLAAVEDFGQARLLRRFATWHQLRKLRAAAAMAPLRNSTTQTAREQQIQALAFLAWINRRGKALNNTRQADLDAWQSENYYTRRPSHAFLTWCMKSGTMPVLIIHSHQPASRTPMGQHHRINAVQRLLTEESIPLPARIAGLLVLLYAQPVTRIARLTTSDIITDGNTTTIRLGDPPTPVPEPLAGILQDYLANRPNMDSATNPGSCWLFPGQRAGEPLHPVTLRGFLRKLGIPPQRGRTSAIRHLALQIPAPVLAQALGYHHTSTTRIAAEAGSPWAGYASGAHNQQATAGTPHEYRPLE